MKHLKINSLILKRSDVIEIYKGVPDSLINLNHFDTKLIPKFSKIELVVYINNTYSNVLISRWF